MTPQEVATLLRIAPATLRTWDEYLRPVRLPSGHRRYRRDDVERIVSGELAVPMGEASA